LDRVQDLSFLKRKYKSPFGQSIQITKASAPSGKGKSPFNASDPLGQKQFDSKDCSPFLGRLQFTSNASVPSGKSSNHSKMSQLCLLDKVQITLKGLWLNSLRVQAYIKRILTSNHHFVV
jgi:hypothetical protein